MSTIPMPPVHGVREETAVSLRFEDVAQDGRLILEALPTAIGPAVWRRMLVDDPLTAACREKGIVPILSRLALEGTPGPFSAGAEIKAEIAYQIAFSDGDRLVLDAWAELFGPIGRTHGVAPRSAPRALAGRLFAEHVFTKPFAPPGERRVSRSDLEGLLARVERRPNLPAAESIASVPEGATVLEPNLHLDSTRLTFGVMHTDSNGHVNSLAYLRVCEEAALRRFVELGRPPDRLGLSRRIDIAYRKPCFAGQTMRVAQQAFEHRGRLGTVATLVPHVEGVEAPTNPRAFVQIVFEP